MAGPGGLNPSNCRRPGASGPARGAPSARKGALHLSGGRKAPAKPPCALTRMMQHIYVLLPPRYGPFPFQYRPQTGLGLLVHLQAGAPVLATLLLLMMMLS